MGRFRLPKTVWCAAHVILAMEAAGCASSYGSEENDSHRTEELGGTGLYLGQVDFDGLKLGTARIANFGTGMPHQVDGGVADHGNCTGTFITPSWVITNNHCVGEYTATPADLEVYYGGSRDNPTYMRSIDQIIRHPTNSAALNPNRTVTNGQGIDLLLLHLSSPMAGLGAGFERSMYTGALSSLTGGSLTCTGWGATNEAGTTLTQNLRYATFAVHDLLVGHTQLDNQGRKHAVGDWIVTQGSASVHVLPGDSGGGCFYSSGGVDYLVATTVNHSGVYNNHTSVAEESVRYWIHQTIAGLAGNYVIRRPGAAHRTYSGYRDVFFTDSSRTLLHKWHPYNSGWSWLQSLGGGLHGPPAGLSRWFDNTNVVDAFWRGSDFTLRHKWYPAIGGDWSWEETKDLNGLYGRMASEPGVASWGGERFDVLWRGPDNSLQHAWYPGGGQPWSSESPVPGDHNVAGTPAVASRGSGMLSVYWRGDGDNIWSTWFPSGGPWRSSDYFVGGTASSAPAAAHVGNGLMLLCYRGADGFLRFRLSNSESNWSQEMGAGGPPMLSGPSITSNPSVPGTADVYFVTNEVPARLARYSTTNNGGLWSTSFIPWD